MRTNKKAAKETGWRVKPNHMLWLSLLVFSIMVYAYAIPERYDAGHDVGYTLGVADGRQLPPVKGDGDGPSAYGVYRCTNAEGAVKWSLQFAYPANELHNTSYYEPSTTLHIGEGAPWYCYFQAEGVVWR
jgi:hypothetical protein